MAMANPKKPAAALKDGAVDAVVAADKLQEAAVDLVKQAIAGRLNWKAKRQEKLDAIKLNPLEQMMAFNTAKGAVLAKANPAQYPAPKLLLDSLQAGASLTRNDALKAEAQGFAKAAITPQAGALIGLFINDQVVKKTAKKYEKVLTL
jgi:3-hydroxyacyl-CoA dehydrogenase/enoyl-CoA hydratase/3-hydroxybutyryl-CoA epimerase/enoyl-CoA isomerase